MEELGAPLSPDSPPLKAVSGITFLPLFFFFLLLPVSVWVSYQSLHLQVNKLLENWQEALAAAHLLPRLLRNNWIRGICAFDLLWRGRHTALVYACNKILMYKRDMADTFYYKSFSPVKRKDGLMLMNVISPIKQPIL